MILHCQPIKSPDVPVSLVLASITEDLLNLIGECPYQTMTVTENLSANARRWIILGNTEIDDYGCCCLQLRVTFLISIDMLSSKLESTAA